MNKNKRVSFVTSATTYKAIHKNSKNRNSCRSSKQMKRNSPVTDSDLGDEDDDTLAPNILDLIENNDVKLLIDDLQYYIDGFLNQNSTINMKKSCIRSIFEKLTPSNMLILLRTRGIINDLLKLPLILNQISDFKICMYMLSIMYTLVFDNKMVNGSGSSRTKHISSAEDYRKQSTVNPNINTVHSIEIPYRTFATLLHQLNAMSHAASIQEDFGTSDVNGENSCNIANANMLKRNNAEIDAMHNVEIDAMHTSNGKVDNITAKPIPISTQPVRSFHKRRKMHGMVALNSDTSHISGTSINLNANDSQSPSVSAVLKNEEGTNNDSLTRESCVALLLPCVSNNSPATHATHDDHYVEHMDAASSPKLHRDTVIEADTDMAADDHGDNCNINSNTLHVNTFMVPLNDHLWEYLLLDMCTKIPKPNNSLSNSCAVVPVAAYRSTNCIKCENMIQQLFILLIVNRFLYGKVQNIASESILDDPHEDCTSNITSTILHDNREETGLHQERGQEQDVPSKLKRECAYLSTYQLLMTSYELSSASESNIKAASVLFIEKVFKWIQVDVTTIHNAIITNNNKSNGVNKLFIRNIFNFPRNILLRLYLYINLLESICFRCYSAEIHLSQIQLEMSSMEECAGNDCDVGNVDPISLKHTIVDYCKRTKADTNTCTYPSVMCLLNILYLYTPVVIKAVDAIINMHVDGLGKHEGSVVSTGVNLFPECFDVSAYENEERKGDCAGNENTSLTLLDIWFGALRAIINMSHCESMEQNANTSKNSKVNSSNKNFNGQWLYKYGCVEWCIQLLKMLNAWSTRLNHQAYAQSPAEQETNTNAVGVSNTTSRQCSRALSPQETVVDRIVHDATLFALTLLTNLSPVLNQSTQALDMQPMNMHLFEANHPSVYALVDVLASTLQYESEGFMSVLVETDEHLSRNEKNADTDCEASNGSGECSSDSRADGGNAGSLPVAEIIITGHICLLLYRLSFTKKQCDSVAEKPEFNCPPAVVMNSTVASLITSQLPYRNWWLPVRILKGFLALQSKTGLIMTDTLVPVIEAIHSLETCADTSIDAELGKHKEPRDASRVKFDINECNDSLPGKHLNMFEIEETDFGTGAGHEIIRDSEDVDWLFGTKRQEASSNGIDLKKPGPPPTTVSTTKMLAHLKNGKRSIQSGGDIAVVSVQSDGGDEHIFGTPDSLSSNVSSKPDAVTSNKCNPITNSERNSYKISPMKSSCIMTKQKCLSLNGHKTIESKTRGKNIVASSTSHSKLCHASNDIDDKESFLGLDDISCMDNTTFSMLSSSQMSVGSNQSSHSNNTSDSEKSKGWRSRSKKFGGVSKKWSLNNTPSPPSKVLGRNNDRDGDVDNTTQLDPFAFEG